jgi:multisubunit Na+/H+ antiporter MnhB subunit
VSVVVLAIARLLLAPSLVVAAAVVVKGYADVGDGFSAGVIVALGVSLQYLAQDPEAAEAALPALRLAPAGIVSGLLLALAVGGLPLAWGDAVFTHRPLPGTHPVQLGTLELTTALAFDLGVLLLVAGGLVVLVHQLSRPAPPADR